MAAQNVFSDAERLSLSRAEGFGLKRKFGRLVSEDNKGKKMNDLELLKLAAKADGRQLTYATDITPGRPPETFITHWNPLTSDGDALRLAVSLRMDLSIDQMHVWAMAEQDAHAGKACETGADPYAATRRAIVRAAAALADR